MILNLQLAVKDLVSIPIVLSIKDQFDHEFRGHEVTDLNYCVIDAYCTESAIDRDFTRMLMTTTVKARKKYGANSLDLTIPASVCREMDIQVGDVFELISETRNEKISLLYVKVHKYRRQRD